MHQMVEEKISSELETQKSQHRIKSAPKMKKMYY